MKSNRFFRLLHKWAGLTALLWLAVLGGTGYILDHHEWRWVNQVEAPASITSARVSRLVPATIMRHVEVDPNDLAHWIGASERGLWRTRNNGADWNPLAYQGLNGFPQTLGILPDPVLGWSRLWLATDEGLWWLDPKTDMAEHYALKGYYISTLGPGSTDQELLGVYDKSEVFRIGRSDPNRITWVDLSDTQVQSLHPNVSLYRFVFDVHVGRGLLPQPFGMWLNDFGGLAMIVLALTGALFWGLPRYWRGKKPKHGVKARQTALRWLFRFHGPVIGLICFVPLIYFGVTGIFLDHIFGFIDWGQKISLSRTNLPIAYEYKNLSHEIDSAVAYPGDSDHLTISTRLGVLDSRDGGQTWNYDNSVEKAVSSARADAPSIKLQRRGDVLLAKAPQNLFKKVGQEEWQSVKGPTRAISDMSQTGGLWHVKTSRGVWSGTFTEGFELSPFQMPQLTGTPFFLFMADIHAGAIFHEQWKWVNDLASIAAILLALSGLIIWWRRKWM